jgi:protein TonB
MRRDLVIGIIFSVLVHVGLAEYGNIFKSHPPKPKPPEVEKVIEITMPKIEPDTQEVEDDSVKPITIEFAPPMQNDVPQPVLDTSFVQPLQPPPPENVQIAKAQMIVPTGGTGWKSGIKIFDESELDQPVIITYKAPITYPFDMRRNRITGTVVVGFIVDATGNVHEPYVVNSTNRGFEENAIRGVSRWKFKPPRKSGRAVTSHVELPIKFSLNDNE